MRPIIRYTAIGDSLTVGTGALFSNGFVERYSKMLEMHFQLPVYINKYAKNGITSAELLKMLSDSRVTHSIYNSDIITITTGGNDLLTANRKFMRTMNPIYFNVAIHEFYRNIQSILDKIYVIKSPITKPYLIQILGLYNPYPELPYSEYWLRKFNTIMKSLTSRNVRFVDIYSPFKYLGNQVLSVDFHPNRKGYQLIAEELFRNLNHGWSEIT